METLQTSPRRPLFAFWRWRRRTWAMVLPLALAIYILSAVPVTFAAHKLIKRNQTAVMIVCVPFLPVVICAKNVPALDAVMEWEFKTLAKTFGPP